MVDKSTFVSTHPELPGFHSASLDEFVEFVLFSGEMHLGRLLVRPFGEQGGNTPWPTKDGREWLTSPNMLSIYGYTYFTKVSTDFGDFFKSRGVTNLATVGYALGRHRKRTPKQTRRRPKMQE
jgi:hypothetical protein